MEHLQVSAFTKNQLAYYDKYWDKIRIEKAAIEDAIKKSKIKIEESQKREQEERKLKEEERKQKEEALKREQEAQIKLAKKMLKYGEPTNEIIKETGLTTNEIERLQ